MALTYPILLDNYILNSPLNGIENYTSLKISASARSAGAIARRKSMQLGGSELVEHIYNVEYPYDFRNTSLKTVSRCNHGVFSELLSGFCIVEYPRCVARKKIVRINYR